MSRKLETARRQPAPAAARRRASDRIVSGMSDDKTQISRRQFGRGAALAAAGLPLLGTRAAAAQGAAAAPAATPAEAEIAAKYQRLVGEYGKRMTPAQLTRARRTIAEHVRMLEAVRRYSMANGDAPATVLRLVTGENGHGE